MAEPYSNSGYMAILTVTAIEGHTKTECTAILVRWNHDEKTSKVTNKIKQLNSYTAKRKISVPETLQVNITEEYEWKALIQDSDLMMKQ